MFGTTVHYILYLEVNNILYYCLYLYSTRTLIIGLAKRPTNAQITIEAHVTGSLSSDLLHSNYVGQLARARLAKQTLDDQVNKTVLLDKCPFCVKQLIVSGR